MKHLAFALLLCAASSWAAPTITPTAVQGVAYAAVGEPEVSTGALSMRLSPGGKMLAVSNGSRAWLYLREAQRRFAVTPEPGRPDPKQMDRISTIEGLRWGQDGRLHVWARLFNGSAQVYAADASGAQGVVLHVPEHWPDEPGQLAKTYPIPDPDNAYDEQANERVVIWRVNRGHGSMRLMLGRPGQKPQVLADGGWELEDALLDAPASRAIYPTQEGIVVQPLVPLTTAQRIAGTEQGDRPMGFDPAGGWLAVVREQGAPCTSAPAAQVVKERQVCFLQLPAAQATAPAVSAGPAPAAAGTVPASRAASAQPSFDCAEASRVAEHLLCERPALAELDVELAGRYRQALARSANPAALRRQQTQWITERDRRCIGTRTLDDARKDMAVDACLREQYQARLAQLGAQVNPPLHVTRLASLPDDSLRSMGFTTAGCEARQGALDASAGALAVEMDCREAGHGRRIWMLPLAGGPTVAASPALAPARLSPQSAGAIPTFMLWLGPLLHISTSLLDEEGRYGAKGSWQPFNSTASLKPLPPGTTPTRPTAALDALNRQQQAAREAARQLKDEGYLPGSERLVAGQLVWLSDQARGRLILRSRLGGSAATRDLYEGSWELRHLLSDDSHLIYPSDEGVMLLDMASGSARRVEDTTAGDWPLAWQPATRTLVWSSPRMCGMTKTPERAARELCHAVLDAPR